jgi:ABC-2 type transport system ATP-binding protein
MPEAPPIELRDLVKTYGDDVVAVDHVSLTVEPGDVFGYLGPNGAGKTTSLRMMLGLIRPTSGSVRLFGRDPLLGVEALDGVAGFVEAPRFYPYLNGRTNLDLLAGLDGGDAPSRVDAALATVELTDRAKHKVGGYSHGMRQRLGIAAALLRAPKLLLLDEPATGLDPAGMRDMRRLVRRLADEGMTVLLSSHLLNEVEELCNRVAIVRSGSIVYEGTLTDLEALGSGTWRLRTTDDERARVVCNLQPGIQRALAPDTNPALALRADDEAAIAALSMKLADAGIGIVELRPQMASLEERFFALTEGGPEDKAATPAEPPLVVPTVFPDRESVA